MSSPMYNLNGFLIRPERISLISPVRQVPGQAEFAFRVVLDGGYEHIAMASSHEAATRTRSALIAACCGSGERAAMPPAPVYAAAPATATAAPRVGTRRAPEPATPAPRTPKPRAPQRRNN